MQLSETAFGKCMEQRGEVLVAFPQSQMRGAEPLWKAVAEGGDSGCLQGTEQEHQGQA